MKLSDFDYALPESLIAYEPPQERTSARLFYVPKSGSSPAHRFFRDIPDFFRAGDVLVLNNTKVIPARLFGQRKTGGKVEALLLKSLDREKWEALVRPSGRVRKDEVIEFGDNGVRLHGRLLDESQSGSARRLLAFSDAAFMSKLNQIGHIPLPPYIRRADHENDRTNYQTVFAEKPGAVAAPTAGLHFDCHLLDRLKEKGVEIVCVTLHASYGTFQPLTAEDFSRHRLYEESYEISEETAEAVRTALLEKRRVIACGTTVVRALESAVLQKGKMQAVSGATDLFIYPPFEFKVASGIITNFHLPKSSLLCLAAAFLGDREKLLAVYEEAIRLRYRFYSYGDAMLIL